MPISISDNPVDSSRVANLRQVAQLLTWDKTDNTPVTFRQHPITGLKIKQTRFLDRQQNILDLISNTSLQLEQQPTNKS